MELHSLSHVVCFCAPDLCSLYPFTCICFHLLPVVISPLLFRQLCSLSSSPVLGSTSHCPITQFPCPSVPLPSGVYSFSSTPLRDIVSVMNCHGSPPFKVYLVIESSSIQTPVLPPQTSVRLSRTFIPLSQTSTPIDVAQYLTVS